MIPGLPIISLIFILSGIELSLMIACFTEILICWDVWAKESEGVVVGCLRLVPFEVWWTDGMCLSGVWNFTCWTFDGCTGEGADGAMKIGIGVDMGGCLISSPMIPSLCFSEEWDKHEKCEMCYLFSVICPLWSGLIIWVLFCDRVLCNSTRKVVQYLLHMNIEMKHDVSLPYIYFLFSPTLTAWTWSGLLIALSSILTMWMDSSSMALLWVLLQ